MDFTSANGSVVCRLEVDNLLTTLVKNGNYCSFRVQSSDGSTMTLNTSSIQYYDGASGQLKNAKVTISGTTFYEFDTDVGYAGKTTGRALIQNVDTGIQYSVLVSGASTTTATDRSDRYSLAVMPWESVMFNPNRNIDKNDLPSDIVYFENIDAIPTQNSGNLVNSGGVYSEAIVPLDTHKTTDRFRWQDMYDAERQSIVRDANSDGLKADEDNFVTID